jgi:hypothetical protein
MPAKLPVQVELTREFWLAVFRSKLEATIKNEGDMIGWEDDNNTVGEEAMKAKQSLLRFLPHMLPSEEDDQYLYRMVLEHGDFGIHNMSITAEADMNHVHITSIYDWETGCIWPALLADPEMALAVDLIADDNAKPAIKRVWEEAAPEDLNDFTNHAKNYIEVRFYHPFPIYTRIPTLSRLFISTRLISNASSKSERTHVTSGSSSRIGEAMIRKTSLKNWVLGLSDAWPIWAFHLDEWYQFCVSRHQHFYIDSFVAAQLIRQINSILSRNNYHETRLLTAILSSLSSTP